jgi:DNA-binding transcriptional MocR family regulator
MEASTQESKSEQLAQRLMQAIDNGTLAQGSRLRSIRDTARREGVAVNTVVDAYNRLVARGFAQARPGSGYYVRERRRALASGRAAHVTEAVDVVSLLREQLEQHYEVRVGDGRPPASWMEGSEPPVPRRGRDATSHGHGYGSPWGHDPLRETISQLLAERAIRAPLDCVLLTQGANHALDLIVRHLFQPGEQALVDSPGYYPLFGKLKLARVEMLGVPRCADGPDLAALESLLRTHRPKAFFTQSLAHNPTGGSLSLSKAHKLLQLAAAHECVVIEDDPFADLQPASAPRLAALDQLETVVYVSSFSKTLSAGLRVGYIAASPHRIAALRDIKMVTVVSGSDFVERVVHQLIARGHYRRHLNRLKDRLDQAFQPSVNALRRLGLPVHPADPGGYYLWVELPEGCAELELARRAAQAGIFIAPGSVFFPDRQQGHAAAMRVNVAYATDPRFLKFMQAAVRGKR